jgi:hypothetical protein
MKMSNTYLGAVNLSMFEIFFLGKVEDPMRGVYGPRSRNLNTSRASWRKEK